MANFSKSSIKEVKDLMKILDKPGWAYWLVWGGVLVGLLFGTANLIAALKL